MDCLLIDESTINSKICRNKYRYNTLLEAIIRYNVRDKISESEKIEVKFYYLKTSKNGLPHDIDLNIKIDKNFLIKYRKKIDTLYFDIKKIYNYITEYSLENLSIDDAYKVLEGIKRNTMNIYDLDIIDFINYVAPRFYSFISIISNGEWVYPKLDIKHYRIDNFQFDLEMLYRLSSSNDFFPSEQI